METQGLLFASKEDEEVKKLENDIISHNSKFGELPETKRKFVIHWLTRSEKDRMEDIARRVGISKTKAYELAKNSDVGDNLIIACQVIGRQTDEINTIQGKEEVTELLERQIRTAIFDIEGKNTESVQYF